MDRLLELLNGSAVSMTKMLTPFGMLAPPLGSVRLKAVEVVSALLMTKNPIAENGEDLRKLLTLSGSQFH